jgi:hypothetical protein
MATRDRAIETAQGFADKTGKSHVAYSVQGGWIFASKENFDSLSPRPVNSVECTPKFTEVFMAATSWLMRNGYRPVGQWVPADSSRWFMMVAPFSVATLKVLTGELVVYDTVKTVEVLAPAVPTQTMPAYMRPYRVISGGQTGADQGALEAAVICNVMTGGAMPAGFKTLDGPMPQDLVERYCMTCLKDPDYPARTEHNVLNGDATLVLATDLNSPGEKCTMRYLKTHRKPYLRVDLTKNPEPVNKIIEWLKRVQPKTLNVAGNSEKTSPGIQVIVERIMTKVLTQLKDTTHEAPTVY